MARIRPGCKQNVEYRLKHIYTKHKNLLNVCDNIKYTYINVNERSMKMFHKIIHNSIIENKYWNVDSTKDRENNKGVKRKINICRADVSFHEYWKSSYMMIFKFKLSTMWLNVRKSLFYNSLHIITQHFHFTAWLPNMKPFWNQQWLFFNAVALI